MKWNRCHTGAEIADRDVKEELQQYTMYCGLR